MRQKRNNKGFTLIEMIVSVAILAVAGVAVVGLFIFAHNNNMKAVDLDQSVSRCSAVVEQIKASGELPVFDEQDALFAWAVRTDMSDVGSCAFFYDDKWQPIEANDAIDVMKDKAEYMITAEFHEMPDKPGLYTIDVQAVKIKPYALSDKRDTLIYSISSITECFTQEVQP
jgi:prepilin-type N-terminal cleavage/methylation domain-containing protein